MTDSLVRVDKGVMDHMCGDVGGHLGCGRFGPTVLYELRPIGDGDRDSEYARGHLRSDWDLRPVSLLCCQKASWGYQSRGSFLSQSKAWRLLTDACNATEWIVGLHPRSLIPERQAACGTKT